MYLWLRRFWRARDEFHLDSVGGRMRPVVVREYTLADYDACIDLYRLNEPGRFPSGVLPQFERSLTQDDSFTLVIEEGGVVVGCGSVHIRNTVHADVAFLSFGLIHPSMHRKGFGTSLLLARLSLVPDDVPLAILLPVPDSQGFYERFGFRYRGEIATLDGTQAPAFLAQLSSDVIEQCRTLLQRAGVVLPVGEISLPVRSDPVP